MWDGAKGRCLPIAVALGSLVVGAILYLALEAGQSRNMRRITATDAESIGREIHVRIGHQMWRLEQIADRLERGNTPVDAWWAESAQGYLEDAQYLAIAWLGPHLQIQDTISAEPDNPAIDPGQVQEMLQHHGVQAWVREGAPAREPMLLSTDSRHYLMFRPVAGAEGLAGALMVVAGLDESLQDVFRPFVDRGYVVRLLSDNRVVHRTPERAPAAASEYTELIDDIGPDWTLAVTPTPALLETYRNPLPAVVLGVGFALGLFAAALLWTRRLLEHSYSQVRGLNASLERKVEQRTAALARAVREREQATAAFAHAASHDNLTGLANRNLFHELLEHALADVERSGDLLAVMFIDLDHFKDVNDSRGHQVGDELLKQVGQRILAVLRHADVLARQGGDEFLVLATHIASPEAAAGIATKMLEELRQPFDLEGFEANILASIGIAFFRGEAINGNPFENQAYLLVKQADAAMYQAKASGRNRYEFYSAELQASVVEPLEQRNALAAALERDELTVHYQPRVELATQRVVGAEALAHCPRPGRSNGAMALFAALAEETGLSREFGKALLQRMCRDLRRWEGAGPDLPLISFNAASAQLRDRRLLDDLRECLEGGDLGRHLEVELPERSLTDDPEHRALLQAVSALGIRIAVDDFGASYASFAHIRNFPIDSIKIDESFTRELEHDPNVAMITRSIIELACKLDLTVIADGVETDWQMRWLRDHGCHQGQGALFGAPLPPGEFIDRWRRG